MTDYQPIPPNRTFAATVRYVYAGQGKPQPYPQAMQQQTSAGDRTPKLFILPTGAIVNLTKVLWITSVKTSESHGQKFYMWYIHFDEEYIGVTEQEHLGVRAAFVQAWEAAIA